MFVADTTAFINGWRDHYAPATFPSVWELISDAMADGRIIPPREVYRELIKKDDEIVAWARERAALFIDPSEDVQRAAGVIYEMFPRPGRRDGADPFVIAEAQSRGFTVVTYEGRTFSGVPTKNWERSMPGICQALRRALLHTAGGAHDARWLVLTFRGPGSSSGSRFRSAADPLGTSCSSRRTAHAAGTPRLTRVSRCPIGSTGCSALVVG